MVESPTGSGKSAMGLMIIKALYDHSQELLGKSPEQVLVGWSAMRRNLLKQAVTESEKVGGIHNFLPISMFDKNPPNVDIIVLDECHHSAANSAMNIINNSKPKIVIGLTGTPYRTDSMKLCFHRAIKDAGYRQLIADGYLSQFHQYIINSWSPESVASLFVKEREKWGKSIAFFLTVDECNKAADIVRSYGYKAEVVTGESDREEQLQKFESGETDIIFNVFVLSEGFDCPDLRTVFVRPSSKGPTIQMAGRGFRKAQGKEFCNIVQCTKTKNPFTKFATAEKQFVQENDGSWRNLCRNDKIEEVAEEMRKKLIKIDVKLPNFITRRNNTKRNHGWGLTN